METAVRLDIKLLVKLLKRGSVRDLTINYYSSIIPAEVLGSSELVTPFVVTPSSVVQKPSSS